MKGTVSKRRGKDQVLCLCKCPTCEKLFTVYSAVLHPDKLNRIYCEKHECNRLKENIGYERFRDNEKTMMSRFQGNHKPTFT